MPDDLGHFAQAALSRAAIALWDGRRERYVPSVGHRAQFCSDRGRDGHYWLPPAQIRTCAIYAYGSHLGCLAANRSLGQG